MKLYTYLSLGICLLLLSSNRLAANSACYVHVDKSFYCVGEDIHFNLYLPLDFKQHDVSIKVVLLDSKGNVTATFFRKNEMSSQVSGRYRIPYSLNPDMYYLQFMSVDVNTKSEVLFAEIAVPIYNFLENIVPTNAEKIDGSNPVSDLESGGLSIDIDVPESITSSSDVSGLIKVTNANGETVKSEISVSVVNEDIGGPSVLGGSSIVSGKTMPSNLAPNLETQMYAKGRLVDSDNQPIQANIVGAFSTLENRFLFTKSNEDGVFFLDLPTFEGSKPVQMLGYHVDHENITIDKTNTYAIQNPQAFYFNDKIKDYLELCRIRKKLEQHFEVVDNEEAKEIVYDMNDLSPDASYDIKEYEAFDKFSGFFKEILTPLRFREKKGVFEAYMYDPTERRASKKYFKGKPMFIVNGMVTRDGNYIANLPMEKIEKVDLFFSPKELRDQFNAFGRFGVVRIIANDPSLKVPEAELADIVMVHGVDGDLKSNGSQELPTGFPDLNPQVYWNSGIETSATGETSFNYQQPDDEGTYTIVVVARDEKGNIGTKKLSYTSQ